MRLEVDTPGAFAFSGAGGLYVFWIEDSAADRLIRVTS